MPAHPRPRSAYRYSLATEKRNLNSWFTAHGVPKPNQKGKLLLCSWNIANLGEQRRQEKDLKLIAHLLSRFDLCAIQEIKGNYTAFEKIVELMDGDFDFVISDPGGNNERLGYIFRVGKVKLGKLFAEVAIPEKDFPVRTVHVPWTYRKENRVEVFYNMRFTPFDRNPFVGSFCCEKLDFMVANVHLYYGAAKNSKTTAERAKYARRVMEVFALSAWAKKRAKSKISYDKDIILVGDMNVPEMSSSDDAFQALKSSGLLPCDYFSKTGGSNLNGKRTYDQLAVTQGNLKKRILDYNVFDFDNGIFKGLWKRALKKKNPDSYFDSYVRAYVSDHRPLWVQLKVD